MNGREAYATLCFDWVDSPSMGHEYKSVVQVLLNIRAKQTFDVRTLPSMRSERGKNGI